MIKNLPANVGDAGLIPGLGSSHEGGKGTHSSILPGKCYEQRSLVGCSPWGYTTERLTHTHTRRKARIAEENSNIVLYVMML